MRIMSYLNCFRTSSFHLSLSYPIPTSVSRPSFQLIKTRSLFRHRFRVGSRAKSSTMTTMMQSSNRLKAALDKAEGASMGCWQMLPGANVSRTLAKTGVDWILVDCEHGNMDDAAMHDAVPAIAAYGVSPIVRIPDNQGWMVKRALDSGAHGIIVPLLYTVEDAKKLVLSAKFPPQGTRGFGSPFPMDKFHTNLTQADYLTQANESILTIVQIETRSALENVDAIAAVSGIDVLFVGPFDLGNNIGHPIIDGVMHDDLHAAIKKTLNAANNAGKKAGIFCVSGEQANVYREMGFHMISIATDLFVLQGGVMAALGKANGTGAAPKMGGGYGGK